MTANVSLRPVKDYELPLLAEIVAELDDCTAIPVEHVREIWQRMHRYPDYECYFAINAGAVIGCLSLLVFPVLSPRLASEAIVEAVVVRPTYRGQGFGRAMMREAMALAASKGAYKLALSSNLRRLDAHRFYDGLGFTRHGYSFSVQPEKVE